MRIGILGGTFDPIHNGHLHLAKKVLEKMHLDRIIFIPTNLPPHKTGVRITPTIHRYKMLKLAIGNNKRFMVSDIEIKRRGRSYSVETLRQLRKRYGQSAEMFFITGSDSLKDIDGWKDLEEILNLCRFMVIKRPCFAIKKARRDFIVLHIGAKDISSTDIRRRIKKAQSTQGLLPEKVRDYITRHNLYT